jgi:tripartite ATP-independent transporter DctP family solute receptor
MTNKKVLLTLIVLLAAGLIIAGCGGGGGENTAQGGNEDQIVIKLHHDLNEGTPQDLGAQKFKEIVEEKTDGKVKIDIYPANQLGDDVEVVNMLQTGAVEAALIPTAKISGYAPELQLPDLPFLFPTKEACYKVLDSEIGMELLAGLEEIGIKGTAFWESGFKQFTANSPLHAPADFKGLKMRVMESPVIIEQFKALGSNPLPISFAETYNALQQGVVDGQENPLISIVNMKLYEVQDHMTLSNHAYLGYAFLFSKSFYDGLPEDIQKILADATMECAHYERQLTADKEEELIQTIKDSGTEVYTLTDAEKEVFAEATKAVHKKFENEIGKEILEKTYKMIEEME